MLELYDGKVRIEFSQCLNGHRYRLDGQKDYLLSVTRCTGIVNKADFLVPWAVKLAGQHLREFIETNSGPYSAEQLLPVIDEALRRHEVAKEEAAEKGKAAHEYAEKVANAMIVGQELPDLPETEDPNIIAAINAFLEWLTSHRVKFLHTEKVVYSQLYGYVGKFDAVAEVDGKLVLIDFKTSKSVYDDMRYQVAAYRMAYEEEHGKLDGTMILHLDKETGACTAHEFTDEDQAEDAPIFLACLAIAKRQKELAKK